MLAVTKIAEPTSLGMNNERFMSILTLDDKSSLKSIEIDNTSMDDSSLDTLPSSTSNALQLLRIKSCTRLSQRGILTLANNCRYLRELSLSYSLLSEELLLALSTEHHVRLEILRVDAHPETKPFPKIGEKAWTTLANHLPDLNFILLSYLTEEEDYEALLASHIPVTHLYFGEITTSRILSRIGKHCPRLVELVIGAHGPSLLDHALISIAKGCPKLSAVGLGDCELTCSGFVEFAALCGQRLHTLYVLETSLLDDSNFDITEASARVSKLLGRTWTPEYVPLW
ncbi:F-box/LRR-repeat protein 21 isoform X2 [Orussus abietinus]|uniref:F-box/LRR-repeat protein 21 isoform X2 n=1 Tax=Orussus abietinus TaxID=222816 RepID=UPI000625ED70|nr:F-box/LRR-repeat protein 21 isoform X2 [Orussus abietinus]